MGFFNRKPDLEIQEHLNRNERIIAWANHAGGKLVVTDQALLSFDHHENRRMPWELSIHGKWEEPLLMVTMQDELGGPTVTRAWNIEKPGLVPDAVRERITTAQVFDQVGDLPSIGKVRFVARRGPDGVTWTTLTEAQLDWNSQTHIQNELEHLKSTLGI